MLRARFGLTLAIVAFGVSTQAVTAQGPQGPCVDCSDCVKSGELGNKAFNGDDESIFSRNQGIHESCITTLGQCIDAHHPQDECLGGEEEQEQLLLAWEGATRALDAGDLPKAVWIARSFPRSQALAYIPARRAIQAYGCSGQVIAHLPLPIAERAVAAVVELGWLHR